MLSRPYTPAITAVYSRATVAGNMQLRNYITYTRQLCYRQQLLSDKVASCIAHSELLCHNVCSACVCLCVCVFLIALLGAQNVAARYYR